MSAENFSDYFLELQTKTAWGKRLESFADWCAPLPNHSVLDLGCGPGLLPRLFAQKGNPAFGSDLEPKMFLQPLHPDLLVADIMKMPFAESSFDMLTASNLIFLLPEPVAALKNVLPLLKPGGQLCMLNPSENMNLEAAQKRAKEAGITGVAYESLLGYGERAEKNYRWSAKETAKLFQEMGLTLTDTILSMKPGLIRFSKGVYG